MEQHSKQSGASATVSEHNVFFWARLKLTGVYVLILAVILIGFSAILYQNFQRTLSDASEDDFSGIDSHHHFVQNTLSSVGNEIMLIDLIVLIVAAGVSYALAGYTLRPIQYSMSAQRKFSENASHELRTPLAVMKNDTEVLLRNPYPSKEQIQSTLRSNIEEIDRMSQMAEDLLLLARSNNHTVSTLKEIDLADIAEKVTEKMRSIAEKKGISLAFSSSRPLAVEGDKASLERVLVNLVQNAIQHTPKSGSVSVEGVQESSQAVLKISDTGSGIAEEDLPHIFERFYKGEGASGSGLGLSIVKELLNQHDGSVDITSVKGEGTTVTVKIPLIA